MKAKPFMIRIVELWNQPKTVPCFKFRFFSLGQPGVNKRIPCIYVLIVLRAGGIQVTSLVLFLLCLFKKSYRLVFITCSFMHEHFANRFLAKLLWQSHPHPLFTKEEIVIRKENPNIIHLKYSWSSEKQHINLLLPIFLALTFYLLLNRSLFSKFGINYLQKATIRILMTL